ncbi:hypothetical protein ACS0TY_027502 [Phlomoides rotata]
MMRKKLPGMDIVVNPHINSNIHGIPRNTGIDHELEDNNICKPPNSKLNACSKGEKRKNIDPDVSLLVESLGEFMKYSKESMCGLNTPTTEKGTGSKDENRKLNDIMKQVPGLKIGDKLKICDEMVQNEKRLEFFLSLQFEEQEEYVCMLLDGRL